MNWSVFATIWYDLLRSSFPHCPNFPSVDGNLFKFTFNTCSFESFTAVLCKSLAETTEDSQSTLAFGPPLVLEVETAFFFSIHSLNVNPG